jgi:hypothetical protein
MRLSVTDFIDFFVDRIILSKTVMVRANVDCPLSIFIEFVSIKMYHRGTFYFLNRYTPSVQVLTASITSNTALGNNLSLNQITSQGKLLAFNPALSKFNLSEIAKIRFLQPDL